jgi:hypothetical protein
MSDYFERIERQLVDRIESGARPERRSLTALRRVVSPLPLHPGPAVRALAPALAVLLVVVVAAVFLAVRGGSGHPASRGGVPADAVTFTATPTEPGQSASAVATSSLPTLRARLRAALPKARLRVTVSGAVVTVTQPGHTITGPLRQQIAALAVTGRLDISDWEGSVLTSDGRPAAAGLGRQDASAILLSQGDARRSPGDVGAGSTSAPHALALAARVRGTATGPSHYYALSASCAATARRSPRTSACALVGPAVDPETLAGMAAPGLAPLSTPVRVRAGVTLVQATSANSGASASNAQFFVLRGDPAINSTKIFDPTAGTDEGGSPDVTIRFTAAGAQRFRRLTATVAHRGAAASGVGLTLDQHFAIVLDGQILTVPSIDFRAYPDGIKTTTADISGEFTPTSARDLAAVLRYGPLAVLLTPR